MTLPQKFRKSADILANYDFTDIASGTGYTTFYGMAVVVNTTDNFILSPNPLESRHPNQAIGENGFASALADLDFDISFNNPRRIKGDFLTTVTYGAKNSSGTTSVYLKIKIVHYDGSTETIIGTQQQTETHNHTGGANRTGIRSTLTFDVDKHFKKGETLRVSVELWGNGGSGSSCEFYHDGANRATNITEDVLTNANASSNFKVNVPFRVDI